MNLTFQRMRYVFVGLEGHDGYIKCVPPQVTALMGAHTLGSCLRENSGYAGVWVVDEARTFNENYYTLMFNDNVTWTNAVGGDQNRCIVLHLTLDIAVHRTKEDEMRPSGSLTGMWMEREWASCSTLTLSSCTT